MSSVEIIWGSSYCKVKIHLATKPASVSESKSNTLDFLLRFHSTDRKVEWHWVGGIVKGLNSFEQIDRTKAKWLNDYSQLQPNLPSSKNVALLFMWNEKKRKENQAKAMLFFFVQTLQSNRFMFVFLMQIQNTHSHSKNRKIKIKRC